MLPPGYLSLLLLSAGFDERADAASSATCVTQEAAEPSAAPGWRDWAVGAAVQVVLVCGRY
jgi:hypothetical protein